jgi:WD40 repeat protein
MIFVKKEELLVFAGEDGIILGYDKKFNLKYNLYRHD